MKPKLDLNDYAYWRDYKLDHFPSSTDELIVEISDLAKPTAAERAAIDDRLSRANMAVYATSRSDDDDKHRIQAFGQHFGLGKLDHNMGADEDAISAISVQEDALHQHYIPYTTKPIAWHTDGYYNDMDHQIHALILHCVHPAAEGGSNQLLDHEIAFIQLYEHSPAYARALMHPEAMSIPANEVDGEVIRPERRGPVFRFTEKGRLHMRYTDRKRSIDWRDDALTDEAVCMLKSLLHAPAPYVFEHRLEPGQGLISRNVLHTRTAFEDGEPQRLLYRARYFDEIGAS